ncbi:hypothetical protein [[Eubacterium] hominis]|uniref:hypothetical protein n=1 Tax=[Eubacterium] hominis TaxID=2764325 RepID=UPI003A4D8D17
MLKKRSTLSNLSFKELKIYYSEKDYHLEDKSFETNLNLKNQNGEYNLLAELLADRNNIPLIFVKFKGNDKAAISERSDMDTDVSLLLMKKLKIDFRQRTSAFLIQQFGQEKILTYLTMTVLMKQF